LLTAERWSTFDLDQQILMIGNEMNRASRFLTPAGRPSLLLCYQRVLRLVDLTVEVQARPTLRRELLLWRDVIAELSVAPEPNPAGHAQAFRCLLLFTPVAAQQIPFVLGR
jgi:hypothetical protein